jgi:hypothetical protein
MLSRQQRAQFATQNVVSPPIPLIAPVKGWNTRDALDEMDPADAVQLDNWLPDASGLLVRNGFVPYASGVGTGAVKTLAAFSAGGSNKFIAAASGNLYDISSSGTPGGTLATGFTNDGWQTALFLSRLFLFNGSDAAQVYDGSSVGNANFTGVSTDTLVGAIVYQNRLYTWANDSTGFWYAQLNSISGALAFYDLSVWSPRGGNLIAAATYSHDGGNGVLDFVCFIMSSGDCLIYYGNDPADINNWQLIGIYRISPPVSPRAVCNYGAEAFLTTFDDHVPLQQQLVALKDGALPPRSKISTAVQTAVQLNPNGFGWQALYYPKGRQLIFNIPNPDGTFDQHVQNTGLSYQDPKTGMTASPWCRFLNWNGYCFALFGNNLYFGGDSGMVYQADTGSLDDLGAISAVGQQAWNMFQNPLEKRLTAARPLLESTTGLSFSFGIGFDYGDLDIETEGATTGTGSPWNTSPWNTSPWSPESTVSILWHASGGTGVAISVGIALDTTQGATWLRSDLRFEEGTYL